ncbi:MAG: hypothetical protein ACJ8M4_10615 [Chthoniobacterales bacterium]
MRKSPKGTWEVKILSLALLLAVALPGCSRFTESGRMDRAYYKHMKQVNKERDKRKKRMLEHQRGETPSLRTQSPPPLQENVQTQSDGQ